MNKRLFATLLVLVLAAVVALPSAGVAAKKKKFGTSIDVSYSGETSTFSGKVGSKALRCERGRPVTIFAKPQLGGEPIAVGTDTTDSKGRYSVESVFVPGNAYYASVPRKATSSTVCLAARTSNIAR